MKRRALIAGITGQDGSYLAELLLARGYDVHGLARRTDGGAIHLIAHVADRITLHEANLQDGRRISETVAAVRPGEIYNLAGPSFIPDSWRSPSVTVEAIAGGAAHLLEAVRKVDPTIRFCQAGSADMFGIADRSPQNEETPFRPQTPYGSAKVLAHNLVGNLRQRDGLFACGAILFNHESPRRGPEFVTRKIVRTAAEISLGLTQELRLGNLDARRDWGFAGDYAEAMWRMLQQDEPGDYVIGTGESRSVAEFVRAAFSRFGLDWRRHVAVDPTFFRPVETVPLVADAAKARTRLGWQPTVSFEQLVHAMADADLKAIRGRQPAAA